MDNQKRAAEDLRRRSASQVECCVNRSSQGCSIDLLKATSRKLSGRCQPGCWRLVSNSPLAKLKPGKTKYLKDSWASPEVSCKHGDKDFAR